MIFAFQTSISEVAKRAMSKIAVRKYKGTSHMSPSRCGTPELYSLDSYIDNCIICLEEYKEGQVIYSFILTWYFGVIHFVTDSPECDMKLGIACSRCVELSFALI